MEDWLEKAATKCTRYAAVHQLGLNANDNSATFRNRQPEKLLTAQSAAVGEEFKLQQKCSHRAFLLLLSTPCVHFHQNWFVISTMGGNM